MCLGFCLRFFVLDYLVLYKMFAIVGCLIGLDLVWLLVHSVVLHFLQKFCFKIFNIC